MAYQEWKSLSGITQQWPQRMSQHPGEAEALLVDTIGAGVHLQVIRANSVEQGGPFGVALGEFTEAVEA